MGLAWTLKNGTPMERKTFYTMKHEPKIDMQYVDPVIESNININGHIELHNILRLCHPNIMETEIKIAIPAQKRSEIFESYICKIQNFISEIKLDVEHIQYINRPF